MSDDSEDSMALEDILAAFQRSVAKARAEAVAASRTPRRPSFFGVATASTTRGRSKKAEASEPAEPVEAPFTYVVNSVHVELPVAMSVNQSVAASGSSLNVRLQPRDGEAVGKIQFRVEPLALRLDTEEEE